MNQQDFVAKALQLAFTAAEFAREVDGMAEAPAESISKYSWYLANSREMGPSVKVVRHAVRGWGGAQHDSLLAAAESHAAESKDALTAVVQSYGDPSNALVRVQCSIKGSKILLDFPYVRRNGSFEYAPSLDQQREPALTAITDWAKIAVRKKLFGIF